MSFIGKKHRSNNKERDGAVSARTLEKIKNQTLKGVDNAIVISAVDFNRIQQEAKKALEDPSSVSNKKFEERKMKAEAHRHKLAQRDELKGATGPSKNDINTLDRSEAHARSQAQRLNNHDDIKKMEKLMLYAQCASIREMQLKEKKEMKAREEQEERDWIELMEKERVAELKAIEEAELARKKAFREGASVVRDQIQEREMGRLRAREKREQEAIARVAKMKEAEAKQLEEDKRRSEEIRKMRLEYAEANKALANEKIRRRQSELEEDVKIADYLKQKGARDDDYERKISKMKQAKEKEILLVREMQQRAQRQQAELDELRAQRAHEAAERKWREQEMDAQTKLLAQQREIREARELHLKERESRMAAAAAMEHELFERVLNAQMSESEREQKRHAEEANKRKQYAQQIRSQITEKETAKKTERSRLFEQGDQWKEEVSLDQKALNDLKREKLRQLAEYGVPEKYRTDLVNMKVMQPEKFRLN